MKEYNKKIPNTIKASKYETLFNSIIHMHSHSHMPALKTIQLSHSFAFAGGATITGRRQRCQLWKEVAMETTTTPRLQQIHRFSVCMDGQTMLKLKVSFYNGFILAKWCSERGVVDKLRQFSCRFQSGPNNLQSFINYQENAAAKVSANNDRKQTSKTKTKILVFTAFFAKFTYIFLYVRLFVQFCWKSTNFCAICVLLPGNAR